MNLTVRIQNTEYTGNMVQGITFSEEYNEQLDSGSIRLAHVAQIKDLKPYTDVYIYESGYAFDDYIAKWQSGGNLHDGNEEGIPFYRHLLVDQFTEEIVNLSEGIFSYTIDLFSETKGLEMIQLPHICVTQPLNIKKKVDIYTYLTRFVEMYSPKIKKQSRTTDDAVWEYDSKYKVSPSLQEVFSGIYCQDFALSNPTLKDVLASLMVTKDMIPYVKDNVVYAKDITKRTGTYDINEEKANGRVSSIVGQMSSGDYCDGVRRQYSQALSSDGVCHYVDYLGFRNKNNAILTIDNLQVETSRKIYKINKMYMCFWKKGIASCVVNGELKTVDFIFLCKQDISPLVKNSTEWGMLNQDWRDLPRIPASVYDLSEFKLTTISYSIGGNLITGWGTRYSEYKESLLNVYDVQKTYIENIFNYMNRLYPLGIQSSASLKEYVKANYPAAKDWDIDTMVVTANYGIDAIYYPQKMGGFKRDIDLSGVQKLKTLFFQIDYSGFFDGALIHSRDNGSDILFQNDNSSSALTLLEKDGVSQKEKLNRFANKTHSINGRLEGKNYDVSKLLQLGATGTIGEDDDVIIYRREYSIYNNYIKASYAGVQDYVLKNFYTSVYAKYRTNQLMLYGESTSRAESRKNLLLLSKNIKYKNENDAFFHVYDNVLTALFVIDSSIKKFFSAFAPNIDQSGESDVLDTAINTSTLSTSSGAKFVSEVQTFTSGKSLCLNTRMDDNASAGNYIENWTSDYSVLIDKASEQEDYYVGSTQQWYDIVDDDETGAIEGVSVWLYNSGSFSAGADKLCEYSALLPQNTNPSLSNAHNLMYHSEKIYKDNKEKIDLTFQVEPISLEQDDIVIGEMLPRLSDLAIANRFKADENVTKTIYSGEGYVHEVVLSETSTAQIFTNDKDISFKDTNNEIWNYLQSQSNHESTCATSLKGHIRLENSKSRIYYEFVGIKITASTTSSSVRQLTISGTGRWWTDYDGSSNTIEQIVFSDTEVVGTFLGIYEAYILGEYKGINSIDDTPLYIGIQANDKTSELKRNMFVQYSDESINRMWSDKTISYPWSDSVFSNDKPQDVFKVVDDIDKEYTLGKNKDGDYTRIHIDLTNAPEGTKSVSFWYFDSKSGYEKDYTSSNYLYTYSPEKSCCYFVFGVNVTEAELANKEAVVYVSKVISRDTRVFDSYGRQVGTVTNSGSTIPTTQGYDRKQALIGTRRNIIVTTAQQMPAGTPTWSVIEKYFDGEIATITTQINTYIGKTTEFDYWEDSSGNKHNINPYSFYVENDTTLIAHAKETWKGEKNINISLSTDAITEAYTKTVTVNMNSFTGIKGGVFPDVQDTYISGTIAINYKDNGVYEEENATFSNRKLKDANIFAIRNRSENFVLGVSSEATEDGELDFNVTISPKTDKTATVEMDVTITINKVAQSY